MDPWDRIRRSSKSGFLASVFHDLSHFRSKLSLPVTAFWSQPIRIQSDRSQSKQNMTFYTANQLIPIAAIVDHLAHASRLQIILLESKIQIVQQKKCVQKFVSKNRKTKTKQKNPIMWQCRVSIAIARSRLGISKNEYRDRSRYNKMSIIIELNHRNSATNLARIRNHRDTGPASPDNFRFRD